MTNVAAYSSDPGEWPATTQQLLRRFPLDANDLVDITLSSWRAIFDSQIGNHRIGHGIRPVPQIMSFLLHELIPLALQDRFPEWRIGRGKEKDVVYVPDASFSFEIKASSHPTEIFGNRSYAQPPSEQAAKTGKVKDGYYLAVNFQKFVTAREEAVKPELRRIRFGWLDHRDWVPQKSATGQQAHLAPGVADGKLVTLWPQEG